MLYAGIATVIVVFDRHIWSARGSALERHAAR